MDREEFLNSVGSFTYMFGLHFFIETEFGNFVWKDPDYGGDNSIYPYKGTYKDFCKELHVPYGRDKGVHFIGAYCGDKVKLIDVEK